MGIEFLLDKSKKELSKLDKLLKEVGIVKKPSEESRFLKRFMVEAIRTEHRKLHAKTHGLDRMRKIEIKPVRKQISYFKPHELNKIHKLPEKKRIFKASTREYPLLTIGNHTLARVVIGKNYKIIEPGLTDFDVKIIDNIKTTGLRDDNGIMNELNKLFSSMNTRYSKDYFEKVRYYVNRDDSIGKIGLILRDPNVKTIKCEGIKHKVYVICNGKELETDIYYNNIDEINNVIRRLARLANVDLSMDNPLLDSVLANGTRVQGILGSNIVTPKFVITK